MQIVCGERERQVALDDHLARGESVVVCMEPFIGEMEVQLHVGEGEGFCALCSHLHGEAESFPIPRYATELASIPPQTYLIVTHDRGGYGVFFCLSHHDQISQLVPGSTGLVLRVVSGTTRAANQMRATLVCCKGANLHEVMANVMRQGLELSGGGGKLMNGKAVLPPWLGRLGWASGVAFGEKVSRDKVLDAVWSLKQFGVNLGFVMIDEGWQQLAIHLKDKTATPSLLGFEADPTRFPGGMRDLVEDLHRLGIQQVGVWHAMMGYRGGIHPQLAKRYNLPPDNYGRYFLGYDLGRTFEFFYDYYRFLREQGVTFIKAGDQGSTHLYCRPGMDVTQLNSNLQTVIQAASSVTFNSAHFNTDCLRNENLFYWNTSRIARAAEDIDLQNPIGVMRAIRNNLTNTLWLQHLMQPDFDAWVTSGLHNETLAIFHALSGSFHVLGDPPGQHDLSLLHKVALPDGEVLRADRPLTLCRDSIFVDPLRDKKIYKAFTLKGNSGVVGAFNLVTGKRQLQGTVSPADVDGLVGDSFAAFSYRHGFIGVLNRDEQVTVKLKANQSDIYTFSPIDHGIALFGCYHYFLAPGPITECSVEDELIVISAKVSAPILLYSEHKIFEVRRNGQAVPWEYDSKRKTLTIEKRSSIVDAPATYTVSFES